MPAVHRLLERPEGRVLAARHGRAPVREAARALLARVRAEAAAGRPVPPLDELGRRLAEEVEAGAGPGLRAVVNATGVVVHTNLGRAPLAAEARAAVGEAAGYCNLELDLATGRRGSRQSHVETLLRRLTGAEAALAVNNNAAAVLLVLAALAAGRQVLVSRGELVEVGGSFRIPDIMAQSGARLVEVGTTNRTRVEDYRRALGSETALILKVHRSNYRITGFTEEAGVTELAALAREAAVPLVLDAGSGALLDLSPFGVTGEPVLADALAAGADLVTASGDKLLGGPQAGLVLGRADLVEACRRHPLARALRADKLCLAALEATLALYRDRDRALAAVPVLAMLAADEATLARRARSLARRLRLALGGTVRVAVVATEATVGGGAFPGGVLPSWAVAVEAAAPAGGGLRPGAGESLPAAGRIAPEELARRLRAASPPVVGRVAEGRLLLDVRTILPGQERLVVTALRHALSPPEPLMSPSPGE